MKNEGGNIIQNSKFKIRLRAEQVDAAKRWRVNWIEGRVKNMHHMTGVSLEMLDEP